MKVLKNWIIYLYYYDDKIYKYREDWFNIKGSIYKTIENYEMNMIESGDLIPSEKQLSEKFRVTRMTVRSALNNLVNGGYIARRRE